ncbi:MAG TPA: hypothetical protein VK610_04520 [Rhodothermales bacterium]|nr:hypothetical protein [Rhodothermales bacterium]
MRVALDGGVVGGGMAGVDQTVFGGDFLNPFLDDAAVLAATLRSMAKTYDAEPTARRDDALIDAVRTAGQQANAFGSPVLRLMGTAFGAASGAPDPALPAAPAAPVATASASATDRVVDAMARALARALAIPQRFRHEFIGQTIVQGPDASPLYGGDAQALRQHLLQAGLDPEESERRARNLQEAADTLALHHVALLEGYRASVREGAARLLEAVDPTAEPPQPGGFFSKVFPAFRRLHAADEAARRWRGLREEDWAVAERRVFRPAFIKAYLQRAEPDERRSGDTGSGSGVRRAIGRPTPRS